MPKENKERKEGHETPGANLNAETMPGHWLLARLGKKVLRPGGMELTEIMLKNLTITPADDVVEFAPGLGATARRALANNPAHYVGIDRDPVAAARVGEIIAGREGYEIREGEAAKTGLPDAWGSVVYGEAMLTMQTEGGKRAIANEAYRILRPGGRYGIHELGLRPDNLDEDLKATIWKELSQVIHIGARPLTGTGWKELLEGSGFTVEPASIETNAMHLLEPRRLLADEGIKGVARIAFRAAKDPTARQRAMAMRKIFQKYSDALCGITLVAVKPDAVKPDAVEVDKVKAEEPAND